MKISAPMKISAQHLAETVAPRRHALLTAAASDPKSEMLRRHAPSARSPRPSSSVIICDTRAT